MTIDIQLEKNITDYNVKFNPVDNDGKAIGECIHQGNL